jgi:hypothetical protein
MTCDCLLACFALRAGFGHESMSDAWMHNDIVTIGKEAHHGERLQCSRIRRALRALNCPEGRRLRARVEMETAGDGIVYYEAIDTLYTSYGYRAPSGICRYFRKIRERL